jgi:membrane associated rhomboid family serine protease
VLENASGREPIFNVPAVVLGVVAILAAVHVGRQYLSPEDNLWLIYALAFIPARLDGFAADYPGGELAVYTSFLSHMLIHGDFVHLVFNTAWFLAFGTAIAKRTGPVRFLAFTAVTGAAGAATFLLIHPGLEVPVVGASGAVAGLMGGVLRFLFPALDIGGLRLLREAPNRVPLLTLSQTVRDRRIQFATAAFVFLNVLAMFGVGVGVEAGRIAWEAHIGGFFAGLLLFSFFDSPPDTSPQPMLH